MAGGDEQRIAPVEHRAAWRWYCALQAAMSVILLVLLAWLAWWLLGGTGEAGAGPE